jgi:hypothetical protein
VWQTFEAAEIALVRDGWKRYTSYNYSKPVGNVTAWLELEWRGGWLVPVQQPDEEEGRWNFVREGRWDFPPRPR